jgi:RimJ/RimL family protein N-acetyltransferase
MLVGSNSPELKELAAEILSKEIYVKPTKDLQAIFWANPETQVIEWCIGFDSFLGKTCQIHVVNFNKKYTPRKLLFAVFDYAFNKAGVETLLGVVNSNNEDAMKYDQNLGFKEVHRLEGMHDDGGDLVLFAMKKADCRFIREKKYAV